MGTADIKLSPFEKYVANINDNGQYSIIDTTYLKIDPLIDFNRTYSGTIVILGWLYWLIRSAKDDEQAKSDLYANLTPLRTNAQVDSPWLWAAIDAIVATPIDGCIFEAYSEQRDLILVDLVFNYTKRATDLVFSRTGLCKNYDDF